MYLIYPTPQKYFFTIGKELNNMGETDQETLPIKNGSTETPAQTSPPAPEVTPSPPVDTQTNSGPDTFNNLANQASAPDSDKTKAAPKKGAENDEGVKSISSKINAFSENENIKHLFGDKCTRLLSKFSNSWAANPNDKENVGTLLDIITEMRNNINCIYTGVGSKSKLVTLMVNFCDCFAKFYNYIVTPNKFDRKELVKDKESTYKYKNIRDLSFKALNTAHDYPDLDTDDIEKIKNFFESSESPVNNLFTKLKTALKTDSEKYKQLFHTATEPSSSATSNGIILKKFEPYSKPVEYIPKAHLNKQTLSKLTGAIEFIKNFASTKIKALNKEILAISKDNLKDNLKFLFSISSYSQEYLDKQSQKQSLEELVKFADKSLNDIKHKLSPYNSSLADFEETVYNFETVYNSEKPDPNTCNPYKLRRVQEYLLTIEDIVRNILEKVPDFLLTELQKDSNDPLKDSINNLLSQLHTDKSEKTYLYLNDEWINDQINYLVLTEKSKKDSINRKRQTKLKAQMAYIQELSDAQQVVKQASDPKLREYQQLLSKIDIDNLDTNGLVMPDYYENSTHSLHNHTSHIEERIKPSTPSPNQIKVNIATGLARLCGAIALGDTTMDKKFRYSNFKILVDALRNASTNYFNSKLADIATRIQEFVQILKSQDDKGETNQSSAKNPKQPNGTKSTLITILESYAKNDYSLTSDQQKILEKIIEKISNGNTWDDFCSASEEDYQKKGITIKFQ